MVIIGANDSEFQAKMGRVEKGFQNVKDSVFSLQGALAGVGITAAISQSTQAVNQLERANMGLALSARYVGEDLQQVTAAAKRLTEDGLMSVAQASQALQLLLSRGYGLERSIELMDRLKDAAAYNRQSHLDFGEAVVGAAEGLKNENSMLVDNAGVTKNVSVMHKEYAAQLGKSVESLTQAEKRHAEYNGIMRETEGQVGNATRMADGFQGTQARLNQEITKSKETLGQALIPALGDVLQALGPVVGGLREMVLWVETLGARAAATYDKLSLRASIALSGKGMFSKEGLAEYDRGAAQFDAALDETIRDIITRADGAMSLNIGKDTGARRKDSDINTAPTSAEKTRKQREIEQNRKEGMEVGMEMLDLFYQEKERRYQDSVDMGGEAVELFNRAKEARYKESAEYLNPLGRLSEDQQSSFDKSATQSKWAVNDKESDNQARVAANNFAADGDPMAEQMLQLERDRDMYEQHWAMRTDSEEVYNARMTQINARFEQEKTALTVAGYRERVAFEAASTQEQIGMIASAGVQMTNSVANSNKAMFMANKAFRLYEGGMELKAGIIKTFNSWAYPWNGIMATAHGLIGATQLADLAGSSYGGSTGSPGGNYGGGTPTSPVVTQPISGSNTGGGLNIIVQIEGNVISDDRWVEERLAPTIRDLSVNRNVSFGFQPA